MSYYTIKKFNLDGSILSESSGKLSLRTVKFEGKLDKAELFLHDNKKHTFTSLRVDFADLLELYADTIRKYDPYGLNQKTLDVGAMSNSGLASETIPAKEDYYEDDFIETLYRKPESKDLIDIYNAVGNTDEGQEHWRRFDQKKSDFEFASRKKVTSKVNEKRDLSFENFVEEMQLFEKMRENLIDLLNELELIVAQKNMTINKIKDKLTDRERKILEPEGVLSKNRFQEKMEESYARTFQQVFREAGLLGRRGK